MAEQDRLEYFHAKGRAEATRMLYAIAGEDFQDIRHDGRQWQTIRATVEMPLGQIPTLKTKDGMLCLSNTMARYVAKKFGLVGEGLWNETLNDLIVEVLQEFVNNYSANYIYWKFLKRAPEPENSDKIVENIRSDLLKRLDYIKSISEKRGNPKFLLADKIQLADVWLYTTLEFAKLGFPDAMEITPWAKEFTSAYEADSKISAYLAKRPQTPM
ncbi:glutathione S-transferase 3-like [Watersipora subatra]|uniref:glutathione S-transferase 3-like n=1 Tax=Watersipora subatra TaxID=2589382 RepID=UPI00355C76FB